MRAVGDIANPERVAQAEDPFDNIVVARKRDRTAVSQVGNHRQSGIDGRVELIERRIAMACGNHHAFIRKKADRLHAWIALRRKRD